MFNCHRGDTNRVLWENEVEQGEWGEGWRCFTKEEAAELGLTLGLAFAT